MSISMDVKCEDLGPANDRQIVHSDSDEALWPIG